MKEKLLVASLLLCLSLLIYTKASLAETFISGVARGDFSCYEMYAVFTSSDPFAVIEVPEYEQNNTDWVRIDVTEVSGSVVHQVYTMHFKNKTEKFELKTDLDSSNPGSLNFSNLGIPLCAANLEVGDTLSTVELKIEETINKTYPSGERETNHVSWNSTLDYGDCYFDKKTGLLVELNRTHLYINPVTNAVIKKVDIVRMTNSNFWGVSASPIFLVPSSIIIVATIGVFLYNEVCYGQTRRDQSDSKQ